MLNHWYILGAGAIGCLWAAHLAKAGHPVTLILRNKERLAHFRATAAITLETESGSETIPVNACLAGQTGPVQHLL
ncbi:MAG: 2-dehydropantoate 2-reductase N-terminal domain-containing protein, partial [Pontibacterium sp.]